jgi:hypothetical protein
MFPPIRAYALAARSSILLARGLTAEARKVAHEAQQLLDGVGSIGDGDAFVRLAYARALYQDGDRDAARTCAGRAREQLITRSERIAEPETRRAFLENIPEHAETFALAAELG